ncbi:MAG TPA: MMPL family transporter, partial [Candidatus Binataceae bacterium]|nr:MMPL family transporter [Candidatus Binataceae bacterium]
MSTSGENSRRLGNHILHFRKPIALLLIAVTVLMLYWAVRVPIATRFGDLFPARHPNTLLYREFRQQYGGAQTLVVMLRVRKGDIFNFGTLHAIQDITNEINALPGVNHNEVFSLASYRVIYARALPGALVASPFMYPKVPETQAELDQLKSVVRAHRQELAGYLTRDEKGALVIASFNDWSTDYKALFDGVQDIIRKHQDANTRIYASGAAMFAAWGYHYLPRIALIFAASIALMVIIVYLSLGGRSGWWAPILTGICSSIWGLGFVSLMKFNFDPVMLVIPLILTARDLGHGVQWHGRYYEELDRTADKMIACAATAGEMLPAGLLAVLANVAGIVFLAAGDIPVLRQIGFGGAVWLGGSVAMVFVFQPILMSYLPRPEIRERSWLGAFGAANLRSRWRALGDWLAGIPVTPGAARTGLIAAGACLMAAGIVSARRVPIGYQTPGTPIYRPDAKVNRDTAEIGKFLPTNSAWIVLQTPGYPSPQSSVGTHVLRMQDDLGNYLLSRGDALAVLSFATLAERPMNMLLHNGYPKYFAMPRTEQLSASLWGFFFTATAPDEVYTFFAQSPAMTNTCIRVLLPYHTYSRLNRLRDDLDTFMRERVKLDPGLAAIKVRYLGGDAGLYLAIDDAVPRLNSVNLALALAAIFVCCAVVFGSIVAGVLFVLACVMANFGAFVYMNARHIGLTVDTIPVISLGIGLGIDYGIYAVMRIRDEVRKGLALNDAIARALRTTGAWVCVTFAVMVGGM